ncbi:unnamed protein product [Closterium sp. Naga37s-1]|nr:unnamed protein product [Closterium sp. Naga37s-1]
MITPPANAPCLTHYAPHLPYHHHQNDVQGSVVEFDRALQLDPSQEPCECHVCVWVPFEAPQKSSRGAIWCFLSEARMVGPQQARQQFLLVGQDPRPVMRAAMDVFQTGSDPKKILAAAAADFGRPSALFYANLYVGLFHESEVNEFITAAANANTTGRALQFPVAPLCFHSPSPSLLFDPPKSSSCPALICLKLFPCLLLHCLLLLPFLSPRFPLLFSTSTI